MRQVRSRCLFADKAFSKHFDSQLLTNILIIKFNFPLEEIRYKIDFLIHNIDNDKWIKNGLIDEIIRRMHIRLDNHGGAFINNIFDVSDKSIISKYTPNLIGYRIAHSTKNKQEFQKYLYDMLYREYDEIIQDVTDLYY